MVDHDISTLLQPFAPLELLSPARDLATAQAAILHGADAVYIGGPAFGARRAAGNSFEDLARIADFAHQYRARVYMTLNTIVYDDEIERTLEAASKAKEAGVDALIVQDMGLLQAGLPDIEIHASTQCDIRTPEKAALLDSLGFSQVVPARELTLTEIAAIRRAMPRARGRCRNRAWFARAGARTTRSAPGTPRERHPNVSEPMARPPSHRHRDRHAGAPRYRTPRTSRRDRRPHRETSRTFWVFRVRDRFAQNAFPYGTIITPMIASIHPTLT